ncbi:hypothetical protein IGI04_036124 [Brassica rapa subsp. trilocularis]|uniref:Uncharacterized protein n=1 Tax=Brassica rapa subsp. trilocularis TaxID=1813537 RepID=A0ABQ7LDN0_BRACM|nr:hypothetical protein IGI04_036124 [Brassica rapa subsp. trilocularis]
MTRVSNDTTSLNTKENQTTIINFSETILPLNPNCFRNRVHYNSSRQSGFSEIISVIFFSSVHWLSPQISVVVFSEEKESAKEKGRSEAVLLSIVAHLEKLDRKFDSRLTEYDTKFGDFSQGLLDTIGDTVKTTVEERLRVLGVSNSSQPEGQHVMVSEDNQQPESNSGQPDGQNVMVSEDNRQPDSNSGQPASKTPIDKQSEDSQPQKTPDKGQSEKNLADDIAKADAKGMGSKLNSKVVRDKAAGGLGKRNNLAADLERNEAELKKMQKQEEAELKRKKKQEEAELKKKQKKEEAELKKKKKQEEADLKKKKKQEEADSKKDIPTSKRTRSAVTLDIAQPNLKPYPKIGKYLISQPIRLHKTVPIRLHKAAVKVDKNSGNNASLMAIASTLDKLSRKFDLMDAQFKKPLVDQKSIDDMVKVAVEERLKVMGIGKNPQNKENLSNVAADQQPEPLSSPQPNTQQKSVCSPLLAETPGKDMGPRNNLSNELDKERGMKKTLAKEFGTHAEDEGANVLDFLYVSPAKATKAEDLRRRSTRNRTIKDEDKDDKKKAVQAEAVLKKKEKAAAKRKAAPSMKQKQCALKKPKQAELMNEKQAELKNQEQAELMNEELAELKNQEADNEKRKNITTPRANVKKMQG